MTMFDYNKKIGVLMTRLLGLETAVKQAGFKTAILRTTEGDFSFFVVEAENIKNIIFDHVIQRDRIDAEDTSTLADEVSLALYSELARIDELKGF